MPVIIQFMHPGDQATVGSDRLKSWNVSRQHYRAFLRASPARTADLTGRETTHSDVVLWGEWEAQAMVERIETLGQGRGRDLLPANILTAVACPPPAELHSPMNTDPWVFGDSFLYSNCQQLHSDGRLKVQRGLGRGSLILFGSHKGAFFRLDTVFVVADEGIPYDLASGPQQLAELVSQSFIDVTLEPLARSAAARAIPHNHLCGEREIQGCGAASAQFRLYRGATPQNPVNGMFSFSPCRPIAHPEQGFARPTITGEFVNPGLPQNFQRYPHGEEATLAQAANAWQHVAAQVLEAGLLLGTHFEIPVLRRVHFRTNSARSVAECLV